ncbi:MAG: peptide chain release factor N(5)-glutamine methyltransferase [Synechococcaceae cyanobacterium SM2_3_2]|nr:peptide chain release factor N(5)-glutamine methyltransferase [Synechococcaceae cyanobacterium SM2_3_2]
MPAQDWVQWRHQARQQAQSQAIDPVEVDRLLEWAGWSRLQQLQGIPPQVGSEQVSPEQVSPEQVSPDSRAVLTRQATVPDLWHQRMTQRIPLQYLMGEMVWRDLVLTVAPGVLIPRPETELLIDVVQTWLIDRPPADPQWWVDLGTGTGAIAIALARSCPTLRVVAVDICPMAMAIATANIQRYELESQIKVVQGSWFEPLGSWAGQLSGLVSNPPYIPSAEVDQLQPEVRLHEPRLALDGGPQGTEILHHLIETAPGYLAPGSLWLSEVMVDQANWVCETLRQTHRYDQVQSHLDLAGIPRLVSARFRG